MYLENPFPGLRPFRQDEDFIFFGREEQTAELLTRLRQNRFLAVVGTSGSGKSSLVKAGLIPALHGGSMTQAGSSWEVVTAKPGGSPIANLAAGLMDADLYDAEDPETAPRLIATLSRSRQGLTQAVRQAQLPEKTNLLVVIDQFEELFRFRQHGLESEEAAAAFVKSLLTASIQTEQPIYVVITMRSDYLGDCAQIMGLAETVNRGEYLIPQLKRSNRRAAIEAPVKVGGAELAPRLVQKLLNDVGDDQDQLPILQHALMRTWDRWKQRNKQSSGPTPHSPFIDLDDYEATGGMKEALSRHADEVYQQLPSDRHRVVTTCLFKTLTVRGPDNRGIRRPTRLQVLADICQSSLDEIIVIIEAYRAPGVTFLMPAHEVALTPESVIDISHESLMRVWKRLQGWVEQESLSAGIYRRLTESAQLHANGKAGLYHDPDLQIALSWKEKESPNEAWARQYGSGFERSMDFLEKSRIEAAQAAQQREAARLRELQQARELAQVQTRNARRTRNFAVVLSVLLLLAVGAIFFAIEAKKQANDEAAQAELARKAAEAAEQATQEANLGLASKIEELDFQRVSDFIKNDLPHDALAYLARMLRENPSDTTLANYIASILGERNFPIPAKLPITLPGSGMGFALAGNKKRISFGSPVVHVYDTATLEQVGMEINLGNSSYGGMLRRNYVLSPTGKLLLTILKKAQMLQIWDVETGDVMDSIPVNIQSRPGGGPDIGVSLYDIAVNQDDTLVALPEFDQNTIQVWNLVEKRKSSVLSGHFIKQPKLYFTHQPDRLLSFHGALGVCRVWNAVSGDLLIEFGDGELSDIPASNPVFDSSPLSDDGRYITTMMDNESAIQVWDTFTGKPVGSKLVDTELFAFRRNGGFSVQFFPQGDRLLLHPANVRERGNRPIKVFDIESGKVTASFEKEAMGRINTYIFSDGERIGMGMRGSDNAIYDLRNQRRLSEAEMTIDGFRSTFTEKYLFGPSGGDRQSIFDMRPRRSVPELISYGDRESIESVYSSDTRFLEGRSELILTKSSDTLTVRDLHTGEAKYPPTKLPDLHDIDYLYPTLTAANEMLTVASVQYRPSGRTRTNALLMFLDLSNGEIVFQTEIEKSFSSRNQSVFSPDGTKYLWKSGMGFGSKATMGMIDLFQQKEIWRKTEFNVGYKTTFNPNGDSIYNLSNDGFITQFDVNTGEEITSIQAHEELIYDMIFLTDGKTVVTHSFDRTVKIWHYPSWELKMEPFYHEGGVAGFGISPDEKTAATWDLEKQIFRAWDLQTGKLRFPPIHDLAVNNKDRLLQFSQDGKSVLIGLTRGWVLLDVQTGRPIYSIDGVGEGLMQHRISRDGRRVTAFESGDLSPRSGGDGRFAYQWSLPNFSHVSPTWFPEIVESIAGKRITEDRSIEQVSTERFFELKEQVEALDSNDTYTQWTKWFLADPDQRAASPFSTSSRDDSIAQRLAADSLPAWEDVLRMDPNNAIALARIGWTMRHPQSTFFNRTDPNMGFRFTSRAVQLAPDNAEVWRRHAEVAFYKRDNLTVLNALSRFHELSNPTVDSLRLLGNAEENHGNPLRAVELYTQAMTLLEKGAEGENLSTEDLLWMRSKSFRKLEEYDKASADLALIRDIKPRLPDIPSQCLDLTPYFTNEMIDRHRSALMTNDTFASTHLIKSRFDGTIFDVRGRIEMGSNQSLDPNAYYVDYSKTTGIKVGQRCSRIHFLHALGYFPMPELLGCEVARYTLHFADGTKQEIPILEGRDVWDNDMPTAIIQNHGNHQPVVAISAQQASGIGEQRDSTVLYQTTLAVDHTDQVLESIDLVVDPKLRELLVYAITVE